MDAARQQQAKRARRGRSAIVEDESSDDEAEAWSDECNLDEAGPSTSPSVAMFDVGRDMDISASHDDPVGLVGCEIVVPWPDHAAGTKTSRCIVDAYAADAPGEQAYVISWVGKRDEHHLFTINQMADLSARGHSADVQQKLRGAG